MRKVSLDRALSKLGILSRTLAKKAIEDGRVSVDGKLKTDPNFQVTPEAVSIMLDGKLEKARDKRTWIFYKPKGVVTTNADEKGRKAVFDYFSDLNLHLSPVGRLDQATSGLLLVTNDTQLAAHVLDPSSQIEKTYLVTVRGEVTDEMIRKLETGIQDSGEILKAHFVEIRKASGKETHLVVNLTEGKNREIRRMFKALNHEVTRLKRVGFGPLTLGELQPGERRELTPDEIKKLKS